MKRKIVLAGGSGFLGQCIRQYFSVKENVEFVFLTHNILKNRRSDGALNYIEWDGKNQGSWAEELEDAKAVINLSGRTVNCLYTEKNKTEIVESRVDTTRAIGIAIAQCKTPPKVWINAGSAAIYGNRGDEIVTEDSTYGEGFSADVCKQWEEAFNAAVTPYTRKVVLRIGLVLGEGGGVLPPFLRLAKLGLGGKQGSGKQYMPWIHEIDFVRVIEFSINNNYVQGAFNCTTPNPVTNKEFTTQICDTLDVLPRIPSAEWMLRLGGKIIRTEPELLLNGRRAVGNKLRELGFQFKYENLKDSLDEILLFRKLAVVENLTDEELKLPKPNNTGCAQRLIVFWILLAVLISVAPALAFNGIYGAALFIIIPISLGFVYALIRSYRGYKSWGELAWSTIVFGAIVSSLFLAFGVEGIICLFMSACIAIPLMWVGAFLGYLVQHRVWVKSISPLFILLINPLAIFHDITAQDFETRKVITEKIIRTSREKVWNEITEPFVFGESDYFFLERGISYPLDMKIETNKSGSSLVCNYNNGKTAMPITKMEESHLLRFEMKEPLTSMRETSVYPGIEPEHVHSKLIIDYGEFEISKINDSTCLLTATTQYTYKVGPQFYWSLWSDYLFNKMHQHVLEKIALKTNQITQK